MANKNHISVTRMFMETKLGRMIASIDGLLPIVSHDLVRYDIHLQEEVQHANAYVITDFLSNIFYPFSEQSHVCLYFLE